MASPFYNSGKILVRYEDSVVKNPSANVGDSGDIWIQSLGQENPLRREWLPTSVFSPGKPRGQKSLVGYSPWLPKESNMT